MECLLAVSVAVIRDRLSLAMRGDKVEVVVDSGTGVLKYELEATKAGRRLEVSTSRGVVEVIEVTRNGTPIRSGRFMASRVVAVVEHPAPPVAARNRRSSRDQQGML
jgi:hypothetical protein